MPMQVFVKNLEDQKFGVTIDPFDTVDKFKVKIQQSDTSIYFIKM